MTVATLRGWAKAHPAKALGFVAAIAANYAYWLPDITTDNFLTQRAGTVGTCIGIGLAAWLLATIASDQKRHQAENRSPKIGPKLMAMLLLGAMTTQASAFDARLLRPPQPTNQVQQQTPGIAGGIIVIGGGGFFVWWLVKKCQQWFGPDAHTNSINNRFGEYGYIEDYIDKGGTCPRLAEYNETSIDQAEAMCQIQFHLDREGAVSCSRIEVVPRGTLSTGPAFAQQLMERTGTEGLGHQRGDAHFSGPNGAIEYGESPFYRDFDGSLVMLDPEQWYYPDDVVTVERSPTAEGPWEHVISARMPRGTTVVMNDANEGGVQFYRLTAAVQ